MTHHPTEDIQSAWDALPADMRARMEAMPPLATTTVTYRVTPKICGAKTRAGLPCKRQVIPGKARCRNHGGMSTGPKSEAGKDAIRAANRARKREKEKIATAAITPNGV